MQKGSLRGVSLHYREAGANKLGWGLVAPTPKGPNKGVFVRKAQLFPHQGRRLTRAQGLHRQVVQQGFAQAFEGNGLGSQLAVKVAPTHAQLVTNAFFAPARVLADEMLHAGRHTVLRQ